MRRLGVSKLLITLILLLVLVVAGGVFYLYGPRKVTITSVVTVTPSSRTPAPITTTSRASPSLTTSHTTKTETRTETVTTIETLTVVTTETSSTPSTQETQSATETRLIQAELVRPSRIWFSPARAPSKVLEYDFSNKRLTMIFNPSSTDKVCTFTPHPAIKEKVYYANINTNKIFLRLLGYKREILAFEHITYVRCVRFGPGDHLYFSEASGAGGNGKIYKIVNNRAELYLEVPLDQVGGFWAGDFEFAPDGTIYISQGNVMPAKLFAYANGRFEEIAKFPFPVMGMDYVLNARLRVQGGEVVVREGLLFTDHRSSIYLYDLTSGSTYLIYSNSSLHWLSDVAVAP